jgi:hypothetical protein
MNRKELKSNLDELGIREDSYSLYGGVDILKAILEWGIKWRIHEIDERGNDHNIAFFDTETEACEYFYGMMKKNKEREERMNDMPPYIPLPPEEKRTFIVSEIGETNIRE